MGANSSKVTAQDKAILDMKNQRDRLHQYQRRITKLTDMETDAARTMLAKGDKQRALLALRRKKFQESLLAKTDAQLEQLEQLTSKVEFALIQKDVMFGLQQGTKVLQEIHTEMGGLEHVEKLMGDTADAVAYQKEVSEMLGGRISAQDEDDVEDELEALAKQVARQKASSESIKAKPDTNLPEVPAAEPAPQAPQQEVPEEEHTREEERTMLPA